MPIAFKCPRCRREHMVDPALAGRRVRCSGCAARITVPDESTMPVRRRRRPRRSSILAEEEAQLDLTPMIDVTFLLLIFFMVTATYVRERFFELPPPQAKEEAPKDSTPTRGAVMAERTMLTIVTEGEGADVRVRLQDGEAVPLTKLQELLEKHLDETGKRDVVIEMAPGVLHGTLIQTIDIAVSARAENVFLGTSLGPAGEPAAAPAAARE